MQIENKYKLDKIIDKDKEDERLRVIVVRKDNTAVALSGRAVAVVPCAVGKGDELGPILPDSLAYARKHTVLTESVAVLHLKDKTTVLCQDSAEFPRTLESRAVEKEEQLEMLRLPAKEKCPQETIDETVIPEHKPDAISLKINPKLLYSLAQALGSPETLSLEMVPEEVDARKVIHSAIRVDADAAYGTIMPMK